MMEKDDALIRDLLKEGFLQEAPEGFTNRVMHAIAEEKEPVGDISPLAYAGIIAASITLLIGILYLLDPSILTQYSQYFSKLLFTVLTPFTGLFSGFAGMNFSLPFNGLLPGLLLVIVLLLLFDRYILKTGKVIHLYF
jgi:hypothetical protein